MNIPIENIQAALKTVAEGRAHVRASFGNPVRGTYVGQTPSHEFDAAIDTLVAALSAMPGLGVAEGGTALQTEWAILRPADSHLPLTPIGHVFCVGESEERARRIAAQNFTEEVLRDCLLARRTAWWSDWQIVGDTTLAAAQGRADIALRQRDRVADLIAHCGQQLAALAKDPAPDSQALAELAETMKGAAHCYGSPDSTGSPGSGPAWSIPPAGPVNPAGSRVAGE